MSTAVIFELIRRIFGTVLIVTLFSSTYPALAHYLFFS